jgi:Zn-dependent hydrolases, including glyoxylases
MIFDYGNGIYGVDSGYERDELAIVYIIRDGGRTGIVDTAHNGSLAPLREAMAELSIAPDEIDYVLLTHVHLDHAGGAGRYMQEFPNAKLVVHARGARHMINPEKLMAGVREVYGPEETERMYGELVPVPEDRVIQPQDGEEIRLGGRTLVCLDTPGHAKHHLAYFDKSANAVFAGDTFGISYPNVGQPGREAIVPTTSPVQFDPEAMKASIDRIVALQPDAVFLTHFGPVKNIAQAAQDLHRQIDAYVALAEEVRGDGAQLRKRVLDIFREERRAQAWTISESDVPRVFQMEIELNAQGLEVLYHSTHK